MAKKPQPKKNPTAALVARIEELEQQLGQKPAPTKPAPGWHAKPVLDDPEPPVPDEPLHDCYRERKCCTCGLPFAGDQHPRVITGVDRQPHLIHQDTRDCKAARPPAPDPEVPADPDPDPAPADFIEEAPE